MYNEQLETKNDLATSSNLLTKKNSVIFSGRGKTSSYTVKFFARDFYSRKSFEHQVNLKAPDFECLQSKVEHIGSGLDIDME